MILALSLSDIVQDLIKACEYMTKFGKILGLLMKFCDIAHCFLEMVKMESFMNGTRVLNIDEIKTR